MRVWAHMPRSSLEMFIVPAALVVRESSGRA
jgi:hypothetical protein